jgi:hypothetical protein
VKVLAFLSALIACGSLVAAYVVAPVAWLFAGALLWGGNAVWLWRSAPAKRSADITRHLPEARARRRRDRPL